PRFVSGRFVQHVTDSRLAGAALLDMYEGDNRFALDRGDSGAPVFDCDGRIAAVISNVITQNFQTPFGVLRTSTAWGSPNVVSVPAQKLMEFSEALRTVVEHRFLPSVGAPRPLSGTRRTRRLQRKMSANGPKRTYATR